MGHPFASRFALFALVVTLLTLSPAAAGEGPTVVVIGFGEPLLAGEAEALLEESLADTAVRLVDERGIPHADMALGDRQGPLTQELVDGLKGVADFLVLARVEYLGGRPLQVEGAADVAHQGRITVTLVSLGNDEEPPRSLLNQRVEYSHLGVTEALRPVLRSCRPELLRSLGVR
jgi:hypothetical protein